MDKKVLIVDDSPAQVKLIQGLLEPEGYFPVGVNDPKRVEEAIEHEHPCVILLDVVMPERNGFQVCRELKSSSQFNPGLTVYRRTLRMRWVICFVIWKR